MLLLYPDLEPAIPCKEAELNIQYSTLQNFKSLLYANNKRSLFDELN